jgi:hypothetical protein
MGILSSDRLNEIISNSINKNYMSFLETGTYNGRSIIPLAKNFPEIDFHTIEIVSDLHNFAKKRALDQNIQNIKFYLGDTMKILDPVINDINKNDMIIFLDAHSSGYEGYSAETIEEDTKITFFNKIKKIFNKKKNKISTDIKVNKLTDVEVPLLYELKVLSKIKKNFLIIIDDYDLFEKKFDFADWSNIDLNQVKKIFNKRIIKQFNMPKRGLNSPQLIIEIEKEK